MIGNTWSHRWGTALLCGVVVAACQHKPRHLDSAPAASSQRGTTRGTAFTLPVVDLRAELPAESCFEIRDAGTGEIRRSQPSSCARPRRPYSTFKLANALIALDLGILQNADSEMTWDAAIMPEQPSWPATWKRPVTTLREGMRVSSVPHFRMLATKIGAERMRAGLARLSYGNKDMDGGIDLFWLLGGLRISADEQLAFVEKLAKSALPLSQTGQRVLRDVIELEHHGDTRLYGKTGTGPVEQGGERWLGWLVGWVERADVVYPFALWLEDESFEKVRAERDRAIHAVLRQLGLLPQ